MRFAVFDSGDTDSGDAFETLRGKWERGMGFGLVKRVATGVVAAAAGLMALGVQASASGMPPAGTVGNPGMVAMTTSTPTLGQRYMLHLHHTHTGENIDILYRVGDTYLPEALDRLNYFLRDHRTQDVNQYDPTEFDLLHTLMGKLRRPNGVIDIVCGYRTPESNEYLRTRSDITGVAEHSQHMLGKAIDIQVPGVRTLAIRNAALAIGAGGVGYYPTSRFVHVDVGPVREWQFGGRRVRLSQVARGGARHHRSVRRRRA